VTEGTRLTSRHGPVRARNEHRPPLRVSSSSFEGATRHPYESGRHSVTGLTPALLHSGGDGLTGELAEQRRGVIPRHVRGTTCTYRCQSIKWLGRGSRYGGSVPTGASSEADLTRGGVQPPSEAEPHPRGGQALERGRPHLRGRPNLERGGTSPEGATGPRARRSFASAVLRPSSEAEFRPRAPGAIVLVGRWGHQGRDYVVLVLGL
jgi:hypothetical protein